MCTNTLHKYETTTINNNDVKFNCYIEDVTA